MITNNVENNQIFKDKDYTTAFADGIIIEFKDDKTVRLIFYQEEIVGKKHDSSKLDETRKIKNLMFEVRLSEKAFTNIADVGSYLSAINNWNKSTAKNINEDPNTLKSIEKLKEILTSKFIDCNYPDEKLETDISDYTRDVLGRQFRPVGKRTEE